MPKIKNKILEYPAIFELAEEGGYNVSFPSFPGCVTFGRDFEEAEKKAKEILELWLEELAASGERICATQTRPIINEVRVAAPANARIFYASRNR